MLSAKQRKSTATMLRARGQECVEEAIALLSQATNAMREKVADMEGAEQDASAALLSIGEARGFFNAAADVQEGES